MIKPDFSLQSDKETKRLVFLLHGYGANGADLLEIGQFWAPSLPLTTFIAPNAPQKWEMGPFGYQWFGLKEFDPLYITKGLDTASPGLKKFIEAQMREHNVVASQVCLVGFSQGAMLALDMMFHINGLGGIVSYAGAFFPPLDLPKDWEYPPVLLVHGTMDPVVPYTHLMTAEHALKTMNVDVETESCTGIGHSIDVRGLQRGLMFTQKVLTEPSSTITIDMPSPLSSST